MTKNSTIIQHKLEVCLSSKSTLLTYLLVMDSIRQFYYKKGLRQAETSHVIMVFAIPFQERFEELLKAKTFS